jgi:PTS system cellobiose-specific IIC component
MLSRAYKVNQLAGAMVSFAALMQGVAFSYAGVFTDKIKLSAQAVKEVNKLTDVTGISATTTSMSSTAFGWIKLDHLNANAYFTIILMGGLATIIYAKLTQKNIIIKLPDGVPPMVSNAFAAIVPATVALYVTGIIYFIFNKVTNGGYLIEYLQKWIAQPFMGLSSGLIPVVLMTMMISLLWFFGLHGPNVLAPVLESIWSQASFHNTNVYQNGFGGEVGNKALWKAIEAGHGDAYLWGRGSFDAFSQFGGSGGTLGLIVAILLFSKREDFKAVAKIGLGPGIFEINEPVLFGLPVVMNPILFVPFIVAPGVSVAIGWLATYFHLVAPVSQAVPWVVPPFLMSYLATGFDWRAPIVSLVGFAATLLVWIPFIIAANKTKDIDYDAEQ